MIEEALQKNGIKKEGDLKEISRLQRRALAKPLEWYKENNDNHKHAMAQAYLSGDYTMKEIAEHYNVHYSTVSRGLKEYEVLDCKI